MVCGRVPQTTGPNKWFFPEMKDAKMTRDYRVVRKAAVDAESSSSGLSGQGGDVGPSNGGAASITIDPEWDV